MTSPDTRTRIVEAAIELLGREGAEGFSASKLAREVGVSKATLFHHFRSIDEVPLEALDLFTERMVAGATLAADTLPQLFDELERSTVELLQHQAGFLRAYFVFFAKAMFDERLKERLSQSLELVKTGFAQLFVRCGLPDDEAQHYSYMALLLLDGGALHWQVGVPPHHIARAWRGLKELILQEVQS